MFKRLWSFAKRHKKKLIFSAVVSGGAYVAWRVFLPRLQERLLRQLLQDGSVEDMLQELAGASGGANDSSAKKRRQRARFQHKQDVSDAYARKALTELLPKHIAHFRCDEYKAALTQGQLSKDEKTQRFKALVVECIARVVSAAYALNLLMLLYRVQFNIIGRDIASNNSAAAVEGRPLAEINGASAVTAEAGAVTAEAGAAVSDAEVEEPDAALVAFLDAARHLEERGLEQVSHAVRQVVTARTEALGLLPQSTVTAGELESFLLDACAQVDNDTFAASGGAVKALLPEALEQEVRDRNKVDAFLDEARDYLESPQFNEALRALISGTVKQLVGKLGDDPVNPAVAPFVNGKACALGKLCGPLMELSHAVLSPEDGNTFVTHVSKDPIVNDLCEALYFQDESA